MTDRYALEGRWQSGDSLERKWLKAITWIYIIAMLVAAFAGLLDRIVPRRYGMLVPYVGFGLVMLAYRRPGIRGWLLLLPGWALIAAAAYVQLAR